MSLVLARIGKPHGLRGEVTVRLHTDEPEARFAVGAVLDTEAEPGSGVPKALTIASTRVHNGVWLLTFEEIPDRTGAEGLRGTKLVTATSGPATDDDDAYYEEDLVGLEARDVSGAVVGTVTGLEIGAAQDRLVLRLTDGVTAYVPFMRHMVPVVAEDHVVVDPPAGLFDLYREGTE
jgi:16S rRNA processing protein RimM